MAKIKTKSPIIHCCVEKGIYDLLVKHCKATGQTKTTAVKRAIQAYCSDTVQAGEKQENQDDSGI